MEHQPLLTIAVPCYNSQGYMRKCVDSLLTDSEDVEIILVNDGSKDGTRSIADEYAEMYPGRVRAIHQENKGHGGAVNTGLQNARGLYFKVVDSDDWVDAGAYGKILKALRALEAARTPVDVMISNYIYDKAGVLLKKAMRYRGALPENRVFGWPDIGRLNKTQYILMHSVIFRTSLLRDCGLELPLHTFYVDNLYVFIPLRHVKSLYYINVDFYHYYIGRDGQSVQEDIMIRRIDQQLRVNRMMVDSADLESLPEERQRDYLFSYLGIVTLVSSTLLVRSGTPEHLTKKEELMDYIKLKDEALYRQFQKSLYGFTANMPKNSVVLLYKMAGKIFGFN